MNFRHLITSTISLAACWLPSNVFAQTPQELKRMSLSDLKIEVTSDLFTDHHLEWPRPVTSNSTEARTHG